MKRLLLVTTALILVLPDIAMAAQQRSEQRPGAGRPGMTRPAPARPQPKPPIARPQPGRPNPGRPNPGRPNPGRPNPGKPRPPGNLVPLPKPVPSRPKPPPRPNPGNGHRPQPRPPHKWPTWRPGQQRPPHFRPIHRPGWHYPHGYAYRRWAIGLILPSLFLSQTYYYHDYDALGIGPPPYGYRWVRYGPDLLLVQRSTGRIADVIYGAFY